MNFKMICRFIGKILLVEAVFMVPALIISLIVGEKSAIFGFLFSIGMILFVSLCMLIAGRNSKRMFLAREGLVCVALSWIVMSLLGCFPFYFSREIPDFIDALFETVSGFTTTGSSILANVEGLSKGLLYWRSFTHWLGGMGVLVFLLAIVNNTKNSDGFTMHILRAESPGPKVSKLVPKMKKTAEILYIMYILLTILNIIFLLIGGMSGFDAVCTAFGTAGTGGFGIKNDSIAGYSPYIQNVCTVFMLLFGVNFSIYYLLLIRQFKNVLKDEELRMYIGLVLGSIILITINLSGYYDTLGERIRHSSFQVASIATTTGFATTDFDLWPSFSKTILICLMLVGACAGSTGGGFKCGRALLIFKNLKRKIKQMLYPNKVQVVKMNNEPVDEKILQMSNAYLAAYVVIIIVSVLIVSMDGFSITTNITSVISTLNNIGPGLEVAGPTCNFADFSTLSKIILILDMLAGRLEIFPILILLSPSTWKK
jgi:trk system potassium uptake protein TrkH